MANPNLELLRIAATLLRPLLDELVFVGGCTTGLLISDEAGAAVRPTFDVDAVAEITSSAAYYYFGERLRDLGFREDTSDGAPVCRWVHGETKFDVMPLDEKVLGFSNRWYKATMKSAAKYEIELGLSINVITAPYFCATKLDAFKGRGAGDYLTSHDLEDLVTVIDGRAELLEELRSAPDDVASYVSYSVKELLTAQKFTDAIPGYLLSDEGSQARLTTLLTKLDQIANLRSTE